MGAILEVQVLPQADRSERSETRVEVPLKVVRHILERSGLSPNEAKTQVADATEVRFNFLGFAIQMSRGVSTGKRRPNVSPAAKSVENIKTKLTA